MNLFWIFALPLVAIQLRLVFAGDSCDGGSLTASRSTKNYRSSPGWNVWAWDCCYDCTYTVYGMASTDKVIIVIDNIDLYFWDWYNTYLWIGPSDTGGNEYYVTGGTGITYYGTSPMQFRFYSLDSNIGGFRIQYWAEENDGYSGSQSYTAQHTYKQSDSKSASFTKYISPLFYSTGRYTYTVSPGVGDQVVLFVDSYSRSNLNYFTVNGADISSSSFYQGSTVTIDLYWYTLGTSASFSIAFTYFATYSVPQGTSCSANENLIASRTEYRYRPSPGYNLGWYWHTAYSCIFTVTTETQYSTDTIVLRIDGVDTGFWNNSMMVTHSGGSTLIGTSHLTTHYYKYPSLTFQYDGSYYDRYGGFYVAYWSEPTSFSGTETLTAYHYSKQTENRAFSYSKVSTPFLSAEGRYTYTVIPNSGNGDRVVLFVDSQSSSNLDYIKINTAYINSSSVFEGSTVTIEVYWSNRLTPASYSIDFTFFATYSSVQGTSCSANENLIASRIEYRYRTSPGYSLGWYWHSSYTCLFTVNIDPQYFNDTIVIRIDGVDTNFKNNSMTVSHSGGSTSIDTSHVANHYYKYPSLTFKYDGSYYDRYGGFSVAYWSEPTGFYGTDTFTADHYIKQSFSRGFSYSKVLSPYLNTEGSYTYTVSLASGNGDQVVLFVDSQISSNLTNFRINGADISSSNFYQGSTVTIEVYWYVKTVSASFSIAVTYFATYSVPQGTPCYVTETLNASRIEYRYRSSPGYTLGWYWHSSYSCAFTVIIDPQYVNDTIVIRIDGVDAGFTNNSMTVSHSGGSTSIDTSHVTTHYYKYPSLTFQFEGSYYDRYGGFYMAYWSEPTGFYVPEDFTAYHYSKNTFTRSFSYAKVSSPYLDTEGRYTYTVSPGSGNGDQVVVFVDSYNRNNLSSFMINGADISSSYFFQGSTVTIEAYWLLKSVAASFSIKVVYFATYSVPQGSWCNGNYSLNASRTEYRYQPSAGYGLGWYWHTAYSCIFTVTTEPQYSSDTIVIRIDVVEPSYINNTMTVYHSGGTTPIDTSHVTTHYFKYPTLTFQYDGSNYDRYRGFYVAYWSEPTEFSGSASYIAYYTYKQNGSQEFFYHKVPVPYLYTTGNFTYTVSAGTGDQVILLAHDRYCNNLTSFTINNLDICNGSYIKFHQSSAITIQIYWYQVYPIHFNITFYYFSTISTAYVTACQSPFVSLPSFETAVDFIHSPHYPATFFKANTNYDCRYIISADMSKNLVGLLVQYSYLEGDDYLNIYDGPVGGTLLFYSNGSNSGFVVSTQSYVNVQLKTDDASDTLIDSVKIDTVNGFNGFIIRYLTVAGNNLSEPAFTLNSVPDAYTFITTDNNSAISALHPPFSSTYDTYVGQTLYWMIRAPCKSYKNYINVLFLDLDGGNDYLTIFDGNMDSSPVLLSYNNSRNTYGYLTFSTTTSGQYALVRLSIDSTNNNNHGWLLTYTKVEFSTTSWYGITNVTGFPPSTVADSVCSSIGRTLIGYCPWSYHRVTFPSIPNVYDNNMDCEWLLEAEDRYYVIRIIFDYLDVENNTYCVYDYLRVYDGVYVVDKDLLNTFCGYYVPPPQQSAGQWMRLKFHSDYSLRYSGFSFTYESVNITEETCYTAFENYDGYKNFTATTAVRSFTSTNYPNYYPSNHDYYWMIENPEYGKNTTLVVKITSINIEVSEYCKYDRIMIYKGRCTTATELYDLRYCGKRPKRYELKTSRYYLIRHHTDYNIVKEGFQIEFFYVPDASLTTATPTTTTTTAGPRVSRVAQLMEELTNSSFYNNENVPMKDLNIPSPAKISFELLSITDLMEKRGKLISVGKFTLEWLDEFLVWEPAKKYNITYFYIPQDEVWKPSLALVNAYSGVQKMGASFMNVHVTYNGIVTWTPKQVLQSNCKVDLTYYPYDEQVCKLQFRLWAMDNSNINFTVASKGFYTSSEYKDNSRWTLTYSNYSQEILSDRNVFTMSVRLKRNASFQLYYLMLPVVSLAALNIFAFVLPPESEEKGRLSILMFCGFLLHNVIQNKEMPKHSTGLSLLAIYNLVLLFNSFFICFLSLMVLRITHFSKRVPPGKFLCVFARGVSVLRTVLTCYISRDKNPSPKTSWKQVASAIEFVLFWLFSIYYIIITIYFQARIAGNSW